MTDLEIERNNFEVTLLSTGYQKGLLQKDEAGRYLHQRTQWMWEGWQKSAREHPMTESR
jgi:hypothetical protein